MYKYSFSLLSLITTTLLFGEQPSIEHYRSLFAKQKEEFIAYKDKQYNDFESYKKAQEKAYNEYKKELQTYWNNPKLSTQKEWVAYSKDKKTRSDVDFQKNTITLETIAKSKNEAMKKLQKTLAKVVLVDTKTAIEKDPLEQKLSKIAKPKGMVDAKVDVKPILAPVVFKQKPTRKSVIKYLKTNVNETTLKKEPSKKIKDAFVYKVVVDLPKDTSYKRSKIYKNEVTTNASLQQLPVALIFAIMHTESAFNPKARSYVPAYGLMQIVPKTAGVDSYYYLYKIKRTPTDLYLYNAQNNVKMGSAYLHILYYSYLKSIKNPQSRLYCTIAAYNTGAGNIAWAFTKTHNIKQAAKIINTLTPDEVYARLLQDLKYDEAKNYLKRVDKRMGIYHKLYG